MKIGVMSDSHQNLKYLKGVAEYLVNECQVDMLIHLGDDYADAEVLEDRGVPVLKVPGVYDPEYLEPGITNRLIEPLGDLRVMISHTVESHANDQPGDLVPEEVIRDRKADIFLYGHSHLYDISREKGILYFNPGHLQKVDKKRGKPPTFGLLTIDGKKATAEIIGMKKEKILGAEFEL
ncbi:MAG: YfcE family phosphodiesterase [bacterium]|nr:YfcE family phosphodiesterase [bacterium]